jgi:hypothetical protein
MLQLQLQLTQVSEALEAYVYCSMSRKEEMSCVIAFIHKLQIITYSLPGFN